MNFWVVLCLLLQWWYIFFGSHSDMHKVIIIFLNVIYLPNACSCIIISADKAVLYLTNMYRKYAKLQTNLPNFKGITTFFYSYLHNCYNSHIARKFKTLLSRSWKHSKQTTSETWLYVNDWFLNLSRAINPCEPSMCS